LQRCRRRVGGKITSNVNLSDSPVGMAIAVSSAGSKEFHNN
jgi:hypothetical protein